MRGKVVLKKTDQKVMNPSEKHEKEEDEEREREENLF